MILEHLGPSTLTKGRAPHGPSKYFEHFVDLSWFVNLTKPWASWILDDFSPQFFSLHASENLPATLTCSQQR